MKEFAIDKKRIRLINMTDFINSQEDFEDSINHSAEACILTWLRLSVRVLMMCLDDEIGKIYEKL